MAPATYPALRNPRTPRAPNLAHSIAGVPFAAFCKPSRPNMVDSHLLAVLRWCTFYSCDPICRKNRIAMTTTPKPSPDQVGAGQLPTAAARRVPLGGGEIARLAAALESAFTLDELNQMMVTGLEGNLSLSLDAVVAVQGRNRRDICHELVRWALRDERVGLHGLLAAALRTNPTNLDLLELQVALARRRLHRAGLPLPRHEALHRRRGGPLLRPRRRDRPGRRPPAPAQLPPRDWRLGQRQVFARGGRHRARAADAEFALLCRQAVGGPLHAAGSRPLFPARSGARPPSRTYWQHSARCRERACAGSCRRAAVRFPGAGGHAPAAGCRPVRGAVHHGHGRSARADSSKHWQDSWRCPAAM